MKKIITFILLLISASSYAVPVEWTFNNIQLADPGNGLRPLTGGFIYDADTQIISGIDLAVEGTTIGDLLLHGLDVAGDGNTLIFTETAVGSAAELGTYEGFAMALGFTASLSNAGGVTTLLLGDAPLSTPDLLGNLSQVAVCTNSDCSFTLYVYNPTYRTDYNGGTLVGTTVVPVPAAAWLFGSALAGLGWLRRKQTT